MLKHNIGSSPIRSMLGSICLRRSKKAIDLPERIDRIHKVDFAAHESTHYSSSSAYISGYLEDEVKHPLLGTYANVLAKINALRQICNLGTDYQVNLPGRIGLGNRGSATQFLFEGMLSAGSAICTRCNSDVARGDGSVVSDGNDRDPFITGQPRMSTCGVLICASCLPFWNTSDTLNGPSCQHQPSCEFTAVDISCPSIEPTYVPKSQLPVKMRTLQEDVLSLPEMDKRYSCAITMSVYIPLISNVIFSIIFSFWTTTLNVVATALDQINLSYARIDGTMPIKQRQQVLTSFIEDPHLRVLLMSLRCGSTG